MYSKLVEDTKKRNIIEEVQVFRPPLDGGLWECPFCHPDTVYRMTIAPAKQTLELKQTRELIKQHIELHQKDLLAQMNEEAESNYEKLRADSLKRVRLWITGTVKDRRLYEQDPLQ